MFSGPALIIFQLVEATGFARVAVLQPSNEPALADAPDFPSKLMHWIDSTGSVGRLPVDLSMGMAI